MEVVYFAGVAHKSYLNTLMDKRIKLERSSEAFDYLNRFLTPLIKDNSPSIDPIYATYHESIGISKSTLYRTIDKGYLIIRNCDLPRRVRYKITRSKSAKETKPSTARIHRTYLDFLAFVDQHPKANIIEIDSVIGKNDMSEKVILTILIRKSNFMMAFLRDKNDDQSIIDIFGRLEKNLDINKFTPTKLFQTQVY